MTANFEKESTIDATGLGLRAYYMHPESISHYVSFPVTELNVHFKANEMYSRRRSGGFSYDQFLRLGYDGMFSSSMPVEASDLLDRYGVSDFPENFFLAVFRETDEDAKTFFLRALTEWDQEETGEVYKYIGTDTPTRPFEYYYESAE